MQIWENQQVSGTECQISTMSQKQYIVSPKFFRVDGITQNSQLNIDGILQHEGHKVW